MLQNQQDIDIPLGSRRGEERNVGVREKEFKVNFRVIRNAADIVVIVVNEHSEAISAS